MEIVDAHEYDAIKEDCPRVLSLALKKKYEHIPELGCMISTKELMGGVNSGLKKHGKITNQIHHSKKRYIDVEELTELLQYLVDNKKDGFFILEHNNAKETRHLFGFLYNHNYETLDFFDSYNDERLFFTLRMNKNNIKKFIKDTFSKYFKDEFVIEKLFEFNKL